MPNIYLFGSRLNISCHLASRVRPRRERCPGRPSSRRPVEGEDVLIVGGATRCRAQELSNSFFFLLADALTSPRERCGHEAYKGNQPQPQHTKSPVLSSGYVRVSVNNRAQRKRRQNMCGCVLVRSPPLFCLPHTSPISLFTDDCPEPETTFPTHLDSYANGEGEQLSFLYVQVTVLWAGVVQFRVRNY